MDAREEISLIPSANGNRNTATTHRTDNKPLTRRANIIEARTPGIDPVFRGEPNVLSPINLKRKRVLSLLIGLVLAVGAISGLVSWLQAGHYESTDDAFIEGHVIQISPRVAGQVLKVHIDDNQEVKQGDLLVEIDPRDFEARLAQARAALEAGNAKKQSAQFNVSLTEVTSGAVLQQASAQVEAARQNLESARAQLKAAEAEEIKDSDDEKRNQELYGRELIARQELDHSVAAMRTSAAQLESARRRVAEAEAQVHVAIARLADAKAAPDRVAVSQAQAKTASADLEQLEAMVKQAELELSYTKIYAPETGRVTRKTVEPGAYLQVGQALMAIVPSHVWVIANFKETQLTTMRTGQPVELRVDTYPHKIFKGHVDSIQAGAGARFSLLPPENATGNYVKVVQRIPVKIVFDESSDPDHLLAPGMSVVAKITIK